MNYQLQPVPYNQALPQNAGNTQQQLVQVLAAIAVAQQEILNRLPATSQVVQPQQARLAYTYDQCRTKRDEYSWLYNYGLRYHLDGTPKQNITAQDVEEHRKLLITFGNTFPDALK